MSRSAVGINYCDPFTGCSGEPIPEPEEPIGKPFGAVPAPMFRCAWAAEGESTGATELVNADPVVFPERPLGIGSLIPP